jgi:hypothetical protein
VRELCGFQDRTRKILEHHAKPMRTMNADGVVLGNRSDATI